MKILVVDDDKTIRDIISEILIQEGYEIDTASDGYEAIEKFHQNPYEIVITDIIMPGMEGIALIEKLKAEKPDTYFIAMSGGGFAGPLFYLESAEAFGAEETLKKPVKPEDLLEIVKHFCQNGASF
ncbi:MAG: response regulator [Candidatus Zixiibacteriota bacterium]